MSAWPPVRAPLKVGQNNIDLISAGQAILRAVLTNRPDLLNSDGIARTPDRFEKALRHLTLGYSEEASKVIGQGIFAAGGQGLVSVRDIEFYSLCEHHLLPFWGKASIAYYPDNFILGLSKIPRVLDVFSRRFQVQERFTKEVAEAIFENVKPRAIVARVRACHLCMMMRGVEKQNSETLTEYSKGLENLSTEEKQRIWKSVE